MQFGKLSVTTVFSQQKGETSVIEVQGGAQRNEFEFYVDDYDINRHFFLGHYFREHYDNALSQLPQIRSGINITRIEVWITNKRGNFEKARNIVAFQDLAETYKENAIGSNPTNIFAYPFISPNQNVPIDNPADSVNNLEDVIGFENLRELDTLNTYLSQFASENFVGGQDYEMIESARLLDPSEYSVNRDLGYISLNMALNSDEILAVAYEYTLSGKTFKVGELSTAGY